MVEMLLRICFRCNGKRLLWILYISTASQAHPTGHLSESHILKGWQSWQPYFVVFWSLSDISSCQYCPKRGYSNWRRALQCKWHVMKLARNKRKIRKILLDFHCLQTNRLFSVLLPTLSCCFHHFPWNYRRTVLM